MTISVGRGIRDRNPVLDPSNRGQAERAAQRLQNTVARANARHENALRVDGFHAHVWIKTPGGTTCTCSRSDLASIARLAGPVAPAPSSSPGGPRVPPPVRVAQVVRERGDSIPTPGNRMRDIIRQAQETPGTSPPPVEGMDDLESIVAAAEAMQNSESAARAPSGTQGFGGKDMSRCGICLGTGKVEGFRLHGGARYVLDASGLWPAKTEGWAIEDSRPRAWVANPDDTRASVEWMVELPTYFRVAVLRVRNNVYPAYGVLLEYNDGGGWGKLDDAAMNARRGANNLMRVRVRPADGLPSEGSLRFTHVEMHFELIEMPLGDMPQLSVPDTMDYYEPLVNSSMELSASIPGVERGSVIGEDRYGHLWKVTDVTNSQTGRRQIFNIEVQLRMVQRWELLYLLNLYRRADLALGARRDTGAIPFSGDEIVQGGAPSQPALDYNPNGPGNIIR